MTEIVHEIEVELGVVSHPSSKQVPDRIPVSMEQLEVADFGPFSTYVSTALVQAVQICPQTKRRRRAVIRVGPGLTAKNVNGYVRVGTQAQLSNPVAGTSFSGGVLQSGQGLEKESQDALYLIGDGVNELTVTVLDERYQ